MGLGQFSGMELTSPVPTTAWKSGRFNARSGPRKLLFGKMYEDSSIELAAFRAGGRIFCIASAGCTAMDLSLQHHVVAVDLNPVQIAYVQRRLAGSPIEPGAAERILAAGRALVPLAGWNKRALWSFLELEDPAEQMFFWNRNLNTRRFCIAFDFFLSRFALRPIYSSRLLNCLPRTFGAVLRSRMERCFARHPNRQNPYARLLLLGETGWSSARPERIEFVCADAAAFLESQPRGGFHGFSLSNIIDGINAAYRRRLFEAIKHAAAPDAVLVLRSFQDPGNDSLKNHAADDRAMIWGTIYVEPVSTFRFT